jgi:hypothetical protein
LGRSGDEVAFWGVLGKLGQLETGSVGEEISWGAVEMRLHLGSFGEIGAVRDMEFGGGN